jgi:ribonucleoside-triphosphate reductase
LGVVGSVVCGNAVGCSIQQGLNHSLTILFATKTCPNCRIAASLLDKANVNYRKVYVEDEPELAKELGLKQAPTLVVPNESGFEKIVNVSNIKKFLGN